MELFLNACWVGLLLPAYVLWRRRTSSEPWTRASFVIICTLGCALVVLFPIISASDDLHAVGQAMEESKHSCHGGHCACSLHASDHDLLSSAPSALASNVVFAQEGTIVAFNPGLDDSVIAFVSAGRAPPDSALSL